MSKRFADVCRWTSMNNFKEKYDNKFDKITQRGLKILKNQIVGLLTNIIQ